jgi:hypothetical protein
VTDKQPKTPLIASLKSNKADKPLNLSVPVRLLECNIDLKGVHLLSSLAMLESILFKIP